MFKKNVVFLVTLSIIALNFNNANAANEWRAGTGENTVLGSVNVSDLDTVIYQNIVAPADRLLRTYRTGAQVKYSSVASVDVTSGNLACKNAASTVIRFRENTATINLDWGDLDTGSEQTSTTYYVYAVCDADSNNFTGLISANSSTPSGATYYIRLGQFTNDGSGNITVVSNDNERQVVATGTVSNGGTIPLPSGWAQDECAWTVAINAYGIYDDIGGSCGTEGLNTFSCTVNTSRVVSCTSTEQGSCGVSAPTANYMIICNR